MNPLPAYSEGNLVMEGIKRITSSGCSGNEHLEKILLPKLSRPRRESRRRVHFQGFISRRKYREPW